MLRAVLLMLLVGGDLIRRVVYCVYGVSFADDACHYEHIWRKCEQTPKSEVVYAACSID
jgi:hypothetical protein